jgi:hypothetical protein
MAEKLCQLKKKGGSEEIDISNPDVTWTKYHMADGTSQNISVNKKPRLISCVFFNANTAGTGFTGLYDIKNNKTFRSGYYSSAFHNATWSNVSSYITSVTDSNVTIKNAYGELLNVAINIYY